MSASRDPEQLAADLERQPLQWDELSPMARAACASYMPAELRALQVALWWMELRAMPAMGAPPGEGSHRGQQVDAPLPDSVRAVFRMRKARALAETAALARRCNEAAEPPQVRIKCPSCALRVSARDAFCKRCGAHLGAPPKEALG